MLRLGYYTALSPSEGATVVYRDLTAMSRDPRDWAVSGGHSRGDFAGMVVVVRSSAPRAGSSTSCKVPGSLEGGWGMEKGDGVRHHAEVMV